jgi:hypothetical protein
MPERVYLISHGILIPTIETWQWAQAPRSTTPACPECRAIKHGEVLSKAPAPLVWRR